MSSSVVFEDIVAVKIDNRGKTPPTVSEGHPLIEVNALVNCGLYPDIKKVSKFVDDETWSTWFRQHLMEGDVVFSTVGTIGETAIVSSDPNYAIAQNILGFRFKKDLVSPLYMLYLMRSSWFIHQITGRTIETVQKSIKWSDMRGIKLELPSVDTQEKIAKILGDLDQKIELNRRMNETLEQTGQTLFKKYFVDSPDFLELGQVSQVIDCLHSKKPDSLNENTGFILLQLNNILNNGILDLTNKYFVNEDNYRNWTSRIEVRENDFVITNVGRSGAVAKIPKGVKAGIGRNMTAIRLSEDFDYPGFVSFALNSDWMKSQIETKLDHGTILSALNVKSIPKLKLPGGKVLISEHEDQFKLLRLKIELNHFENTHLSSVRDLLLPRLMSAQIEI